MAAMFSIEITGSMHSSLLSSLNTRIVRGTKIIRDTSFVTNIEVKNTPKMKNKESVAIVLKFELNLIRGLKRLSCLKPSKTVSIMKRVPRVCQSMFLSNPLSGGVIIKETKAAINETRSIGSFFIVSAIFFIMTIISKMKQMSTITLFEQFFAICRLFNTVNYYMVKLSNR